MQYHQEPQFAQPRGQMGADLHAGVHKFMNGVYAWMSAGIGVTAAVAWGISRDINTVMMIYNSPIYWVLIIATLGMSWFLPSRIPRMDKGVAIGLFMVFAALLGASLSAIPLIYTAASIGTILLATIGMFAGMAFIGFVTKKDLTGMGQFLVMVLIGAVIASLVNVVFLHSGGMSLLLSGVVAVVAAGLTAYHTQAVKQLYMMHGGGSNLAILGALLLYVDFINLFLSLLRLFGSTRD